MCALREVSGQNLSKSFIQNVGGTAVNFPPWPLWQLSLCEAITCLAYACWQSAPSFAFGGQLCTYELFSSAVICLLRLGLFQRLFCNIAGFPSDIYYLIPLLCFSPRLCQSCFLSTLLNSAILRRSALCVTWRRMCLARMLWYLQVCHAGNLALKVHD